MAPNGAIKIRDDPVVITSLLAKPPALIQEEDDDSSLETIKETCQKQALDLRDSLDWLDQTRQRCRKLALDHYALQLRLDALEEKHRSSKERRNGGGVATRQSIKKKRRRRRSRRRKLFVASLVLVMAFLVYFGQLCGNYAFLSWTELPPTIEDDDGCISGRLLARHVLRRFASVFQEYLLLGDDNINNGNKNNSSVDSIGDSEKSTGNKNDTNKDGLVLREEPPPPAAANAPSRGGGGFPGKQLVGLAQRHVGKLLEHLVSRMRLGKIDIGKLVVRLASRIQLGQHHDATGVWSSSSSSSKPMPRRKHNKNDR